MAKKKVSKKAKTTKKVTKKALSPDELKDLDLDPVEDKEMIEALSKDQEVEVKDDLLEDLEPKVSDKNIEPEVKKAEKVEQKQDIAELKKVAKTENELMDMIALAKMNGVKELEISKKLMDHYNRQSKETPNYFWYSGVMLALEGKLEAVKADLTRQLY